MKKTRRWLALLLAVILVGSNALYQIGTSMSASETETTAESGQQDDSAAVPETQDQDTASLDQQKDTGGVQVQEVTPQTQQEKTNSQSEAAKTQQVQPAQNNTSASDQNTQAVSGTESAQKTPEEKNYHVTIQKSDVDGGTIKAWGADGNKADVTYNSENKYVKEVKEGEEFNFEITAKDTYKVAKVTDQNGTTIEPKAVNNNVYTYEVKNITAERTYSITYVKEEVKKAESTSNGDQQKSDDEQSEDADDDGEPAAKAQENVNVVSGSDDKEKVESVAETHEDTDTEKWITVGKSVTLTSKDYQYGNYSHEWSIEDDSKKIVSKSGWGSSITVKGLKEGTATVKDKVTWTTGSWWNPENHEDTITYTVHVIPRESAKSITINGADSVTQFKDINLTYTLTPAGAEGTVQWSSSNEDILTVDSSGKVTGLRRGQATVTANVYSGQSLLCSATKTIQVVEDTTVTGESATVYYLFDPTKDANSNDTGNWGPAYGEAKVNVTGATWTGGKNCFDNVDQRVVSWPNGTNVVTRDSDAWNQIFDNYKSSVEQQLGMTITKDDVVSITLRPAKISRNNGTNPDKHLDCNVDVNCKGVSIVHYYLLDKSSDPNSTEYVHQGSKSYINGNTTNPETVTGKSFPTTKTGTDGATYTFSGWYTDQELTQPATFPYTVNSNVNFYAKYVAGRQVVYNLDGGSFSDGSALTEKHNEGENVVVKSEPTRKGYKFTGWTVEGLAGVSSIDSGARFQMPNNNVTITANWEEQKIKDFITLTPTDVTEVYNGEAHAAGTAKVAGKAEGADISDLKIEYQKADGTWTENPAEITATNVSDSKTVKVRVSSEGKYTGTLTVEEKLTITRRPVTVTANSYQKTFGEADPAFTAKVEGTLGNDKVDYKLSRETGEDVGTYTITPTGDEKQGNYKVTYKPGTLTIVAAQRTTELSVTSYNGVYDAKKHTITVNGTVAGDQVAYSYDGGKTWVTDLKEYKNVTKGSVAIQVKVTNTNYTPSETILNGTVTITPFPLVVTAEDKSKVFGEKDPKLTATETSGVEGKEKPDNQKIERTMTREAGENVGNYKITASGETTQGNYTVTYNPGTLTITAGSRPADRQLSVTSYNGVYDAQKHTITVNNVLDGDVVEYSYDGGKTWTTDLTKYTDVTNTTIKVRVTNANYDPNPVDLEGTVTITPKPVTVTARSYSKTFGAADPVFKADTAGTLNGDKITYDISRETGENVGTYKITPAGEAVQGNYNVTYATGTLTITASDREKAVEVTSYNGVYDAKNHTIEVKNLVDGDHVEYSYDNGTTWTTDLTKYKDVTDTTILVKVTNANYAKVPQLTGTVTITRFPLVVTADDKSKVYGSDDPELTATETSELKGKEKPDDQKIEHTQTREAGENVGDYEITASGETTQGNYTVTYKPGTLKITKAERKKDIEVVNYKDVYDAGNHTIEVKNLVVGDKVEYSYDDGKTWTTDLKQYKDVTAEVKIQVKVTNDNYKPVDIKTGTVEITRRPVTVTANSYQKTFGEADPEFSAKVEGTLGNDKVDYKLSREKGEDVGDYAITPAGEEEQGNYKVTYKPGTLTIVAAQRVTALSVTSYNGVYDAENHTITVNGTVDGDKVEYSYDGGKTWVTDLKEYKNVTKGSVAIQVKITNKNYTPAETILSGSVTITPAALTITTPKAEKVYDGNALTADGTISGFVNGETATFVTTGSQTEVGNSKNTYTLTWDGTAKEANYTVSDSVGTLKVTKQSIVPDPDNPESYKDVTIDDPSDATYDGKEHKWTPVVTDKDGNELKEGTDYEVSYSKDDFTNVTGEIKVTITGKGNYTGTVDKTYQITPKAVIITTDSDTRAFNDQPLTAPGRVDGIVAGETYGFTVTGTQTYVGSSANSYQMTWAKKGENKYTAKKSNYKVEENIGTLTVTDGTPENPVTPSLVVNKTHDTDKTYKAGDVITFTITVKNIYDEAKTITLEEQEGVTLDKTTFENVKPGKEITATATYTVTEADIVNGTFTNNVKATFSGVDKEYTGTDTVDKFEESRPHMTITKVTKDAGKDHIYKLGETINYVITVKNDGNLTLTNVKIEDALTGNAGENAWTIDTFAPGETQTFETSYVVTEADVIAGKVVNNATGEAENPDPKKEETPVTPGEKEDPVETPNPGLTVIKTSDKTGEVKLGDKITYTITVTNNGNVTISGVKLEDSLTGDDWTLGNIKPGETVTKKTTYTVTEKDIIAGKVENHATATGKEPGGKDITGEGEKTVTTEESNPQITVTKETTSTPKNGKTYALGEKITYKITAKNTGNLTLTDVTVSDKLTGNTGDKAFKIDGKFKPGEEATFEASYTVKESDLGKTVVNEATAAGKTTDPKNPEPGVTPGTTEDPVDQKNPAMTITKKVTDKKEEYQIGDTVKYEITVKNTGNTTQNNVLVEDRMNAAGSAVITKVEGAKGTIDGANVTLDTLAPGKEATITAEYTVVKEDRGNTITNAAVAKGEGETPVTPEVPVDVEDVYDIHVTHVFADGEESNAALPEDYDIENLKPGTTKLLNAEEVNGYTAYPAAQRVTIEEEDVTVTFVYYKDAIGTDPANPDQPDNIPDRYQAVVKFEAVNGTVNIDHAVVTLFDENNKPAENGVGHLSLLQIANATADAGYDQSSLSWAPETPTIRYEITGEMTFTASFTATPATPGTTPANPTNPTPATSSTPANPAPSTPSAPANQTPARSTNIITRAAEAIADGAERIASDVREVLNNDDEDVPLAKQKLDDHKCCILHFLIMLLAAILYGFYTHNMKKRQKKMFEAREELDLELARRGLPTTKEQEQM